MFGAFFLEFSGDFIVVVGVLVEAFLDIFYEFRGFFNFFEGGELFELVEHADDAFRVIGIIRSEGFF